MTILRGVPLVSVVVTTKNEENNIEKCLNSIKNQSWKNIELIVVDNYSTDRTLELANQYTDRLFSLGPERSAQRNFGIIEASSGEYSIYIDADMTLSHCLIEACVHKIQDCDAIGLYVDEKIYGDNLFCKMRNFERSFYGGTPIDGVRFFKRDAFKEAGGFDDNLFRVGSGEDWDLDKKLKKYGKLEILKNPYGLQKNSIDETSMEVEACLIHDESNIGLMKHYQKKLYYTKGFAGYIKKWGRQDPDIKKQFGIRYRYWIVFTENGKWKKIVSHPILFMLLYFHKFIHGCLFIYGWKK